MVSTLIVVFASAAAVIAVGAFIWTFCVPWRRTRRDMEAAIAALATIERIDDAHLTDLEHIEQQAFPEDGSELLRHAWGEFRDTLHRQRLDVGVEDVDDGFAPTDSVVYRQTVPAEVYFTADALVHTPMRTEFFKHFPGILTAFGIVGTFSGLILGLSQFSTTGTIEEVNESVNELVYSVQHAFYVSGGFIFLAVLATIIEKIAITRQTKRVQTICTEVDRLFDAGAGEEYLSRLVVASESAADRTGKLKDALVEDLREMIDRQIQATVAAVDRGAQLQAEAANANAEAIGERVAASISETLAPAMESMSSAMNVATGDTDQRVGALIADVMRDLNAQIQDTFGGQITELNALMAGTSDTLQRTADRFDSLVRDMQSSSTTAVEEMTRRIEEAVTAMSSRQAEQEAQSQQHMQALLEQVHSQIGELTGSIVADVTNVADRMGEEQSRLAAATTGSVDQLADQVRALASTNSDIASAANAAVAGMGRATGDTVQKLDDASGRMLEAVGQMADSASRIKQDISSVASSADALKQASNAVRETVEGAKAAAEAFERAATTASKMVGEAEELASTIGRDTRVAAELVGAVERSSEKLGTAQAQVQTYLDGVVDVLGTTHREFAEQVTNSLRTGNEAFHKELSTATGHLRTAVQDLGDVAEKLVEINDAIG